MGTENEKNHAVHSETVPGRARVPAQGEKLEGRSQGWGRA